MTVVMNPDLAQQGAETGALVAASHADRQVDDWSVVALLLFKYYARMHPEGFMTEDVRAWADKIGVEPPPDNRAWGWVAKKLASEGEIYAAGYDKQKSANCHASPKTVWKRK